MLLTAAVRLADFYESWTIVYHKRTYRPRTGLRVHGFTLFTLLEPKHSRIVSVAQNLQWSQAHLTCTYELERRRRFYVQKLAYLTRMVPRKVQDAIDGLLKRGDRRWSLVMLSKARDMEKIDLKRKNIQCYQLVLRSI